MPSNEIQICIECGKDNDPGDASRCGERLYGVVENLMHDSSLREHFAVRSIACLGNCDHRCRLTIASLDKWSWSIGDIDPATDKPFLEDFLKQWAENPTGLIPKKDRSQLLLDKALGRHAPLIKKARSG